MKMNKENELLQDIETLDRYLNWIGDFLKRIYVQKKVGKKMDAGLVLYAIQQNILSFPCVNSKFL